MEKRSATEILNDIAVVRSGMIRHVECEITDDVSKKYCFFHCTEGWVGPGAFRKKNNSYLALESNHEMFIHPSRTATLNIIN